MSLFPEVREELVATAARRAAAHAPRRRRSGAVAVAIGVACTVAVVVGAVVALGHRAPAPKASDQSPGSVLAALEAKLAILRRPQTPSDRTYARYATSPRDVMAKLSRLATTINVYEATVPGRVVAVINRDIHGRVVRTTLQ